MEDTEDQEGQGQLVIFIGWPGVGSSSRRKYWSRDLEEVREGVPWLSRKRPFKEERTASVKALG